MAGTQETASPVTLPDEDEEMEVEETPLPAKVYLPKSLQLYNMCLFDCLILCHINTFTGGGRQDVPLCALFQTQAGPV
jgi:hypothetical protein